MWLNMAEAPQAAPNWVQRRVPATPRTAVSFFLLMSYHMTRMSYVIVESEAWFSSTSVSYPRLTVIVD